MRLPRSEKFYLNQLSGILPNLERVSKACQDKGLLVEARDLLRQACRRYHVLNNAGVSSLNPETESTSSFYRGAISTLESDVAMFMDNYWYPLTPFKDLKKSYYTEQNEQDDCEYFRRFTFYGEFDRLNPSMNNKSLDASVYDYIYELKNALLSTVSFKSPSTKSEDSILEPRKFASDIKTHLKTIKEHLDRYEQQRNKPIAAENTAAQISAAEFHDALRQLRKTLINTVSAYAAVHTALPPQFRRLTKDIRTLRISLGEVKRNWTCVETRSTRKLLPTVDMKVLNRNSAMKWLVILQKLERLYLKTYQKLAAIHTFNMGIFKEMMTLLIGSKVYQAKLTTDWTIGKLVPATVRGNVSELSEESMCSVCFASFDDSSEMLRRLSCGHVFHVACIDTWIKMGKYTCPFCRSQMFEENDRRELLRLKESEVINDAFDDVEYELEHVAGGDINWMSDPDYEGNLNEMETDETGAMLSDIVRAGTQFLFDSSVVSINMFRDGINEMDQTTE